jgi:glucose-6-phosphate 1-dehydrogenase
MNPKSSNAEPAAVVILGASGDLTARKLVPALHSLGCEGLLSAGTQVIGLARSPLSDQEFRHQLSKACRLCALNRASVLSGLVRRPAVVPVR